MKLNHKVHEIGCTDDGPVNVNWEKVSVATLNTEGIRAYHMDTCAS